MKLVLTSTFVGAASAFAPSATPASPSTRSSSSLFSEKEEAATVSTPAEKPESEDTVYYSILSEEEPQQQPDYQPWQVNAYGKNGASTGANAINGWIPDASKPLFGLPGDCAPTGYFDPLGFCQTGISLNDVKRYRESEVMHGRVAMLATVGYFSGEAISGPFSITGPANDQLQQVPLPAFLILTGAIAAAELKRATIGWMEPGFKSLWTLRDNYYPGDLGFDPLGLKPSDPEKFAQMQTKELQNGRLAMLGIAGMCSQELVNHKTIFATIDFYQKVYSGVNPYDY